MLGITLSLFLVALLAPAIVRRGGTLAATTLAACPLTALILLGLRRHAHGDVSELWHWLPGLGINAALRLDGLSWLMSLLVLGIGTLIVIYAATYLKDDPRRPRFFGILFAFMGAMLGVVLADDVLLLFVFWELTSLTSFLLIGYEHEKPEARRAAFQGLIVTAGGGLVLLAGLILLGSAAGSWEISAIIAAAHEGRMPALALPLIAIGCFTKSAQFPFHFWLPNAMAAPTPVSAYLHSATMVKAGVYLLARLHPALGGSEAWFWWIAPIGAITMLLGAAMAWRSSGVKRVLAYTTLMALGLLTMLLGLGEPEAAMAYLLAHALYKGALFLVAGILAHEAAATDFHQLSGQRRALPLTMTAAMVSALSLAGLPPVFGFIAKEALLEAGLHAPWAAAWISASVLASALVIATAAVIAIRPWFGPARAPTAHVHEAPWPMLLGPVLLSLLSLASGLVPALAEPLVDAAARAAGADQTLHLALWHGLNAALGLSALALLLGIGLYAAWLRWQTRAAALTLIDRVGPEAIYEKLMAGLFRGSAALAARLQCGLLRVYVQIILGAAMLLIGATVLVKAFALIHVPPIERVTPTPFIVGLLILVTALGAVRLRSVLASVLALSGSGFSVAMIYVWYSAPDVAITQVLVETLTAILLVLALFRLPDYRRLTSPRRRVFDLAFATAMGMVMTGLIWMVLDGREHPSIAGWFVENSVTLGHGRNIVNVILVDFRALDTLGEIFVLGLAAVGVYAMLLARRPETHPSRGEPGP